MSSLPPPVKVALSEIAKVTDGVSVLVLSNKSQITTLPNPVVAPV